MGRMIQEAMQARDQPRAEIGVEDMVEVDADVDRIAREAIDRAVEADRVAQLERDAEAERAIRAERLARVVEIERGARAGVQGEGVQGHMEAIRWLPRPVDHLKWFTQLRGPMFFGTLGTEIES